MLKKILVANGGQVTLRLLSLAAIAVATLAFAEAMHLFARDACQGLIDESLGNCRLRVMPHIIAPSIIFGAAILALIALILLPALKADK